MANDTASRPDLDIVEMPATALAAYWLSLKKLMDSRKGGRIVQEEMAAVSEPTIRLLLETAFGSSLPEEALRRLFTAGRRQVLADLRRKLDCMARTLLAMAAGDNPQRVLSILTALFAVPPVREATAMEAVYGLVEKVRAGDPSAGDPAAVDHGLAPEILLVRLMYCLVAVRREGREACRRLAGSARSLFFAEGLILVADGFDEAFLRRRLTLHRRSLLTDAAGKLTLAEELCLGLRARYSYEDLWRVARAYLPRDRGPAA
uniref:Uncharacterized protein n=1 Tax=Desulfovibrio sp. U5L TaxID=596152 RepID=I2Q7C9_9BACT